ncbi:MAG: T9SS type A sorting domain-containing protein [Bacteroidales bacterium]|nr:T9SS type A sorting domain-containing protein [Bacteroidales bacterium]
MKRQITLLSIFIILFGSGFAQTSKRVLFIGNSYTAVNNLPQIVSELATSAGDHLIFDSNTPGGQTFQGHSTNSISLQKIMSGNWDFVVLQEQSQLPSFPDWQVQASVFPYAKILDSLIHAYNPCGETMFYMTWGRKNGDADNCPSWPPLCTYEGMDSLLYLRYMMMAEENNALVSPVGAVWKYLRQNHPHIELYSSDESHPSLAGSYAAACCFYTSIFRKDPMSITNDYNLPAADAANIRAAVKTIVYENLLNWHIGEYDPIANFSFDISNNMVEFTNLSTNASSYKWDFGDGETSTDISPNHVYDVNDIFTVTLIANYCDYSDTTKQSINIITSSVEDPLLQKSILLYPNPVSDQLIINLENIDEVYVLNSIGQTFTPSHTSIGTSTSIDFSSFPSGIYFLVISTNGKLVTHKAIKE